jgi:paraquat-inducible protein A
MALSLTAIFVLILAVSYPMLNFEVIGRLESGFLTTGIFELCRQGYLPLALLVFFCAILAPSIYLFSVFYISTACVMKIRLPLLRLIFEMMKLVEPWNLIPVFTIATLVASVKLRMLGNVQWEIGSRWVLGVSVLTLFCEQVFDRHVAEQRLRILGI